LVLLNTSFVAEITQSLRYLFNLKTIYDYKTSYRVNGNKPVAVEEKDRISCRNTPSFF